MAGLDQLMPMAAALLAAATMGFAIQRGGTCMVAAVEEAAARRWPARLLALAEASIWVGGLLAIARLAGMPLAGEPVHPVGLWTIAGGILLGIGALINGACVFGSVARIGSGNWHFFLTPIGFFLGSLVHRQFGFAGAAGMSASQAWSPGGFALIFLAPFLVYRTIELLFAARQGRLAAKLWLAHHATVVIGITFVILLLLAGPWTYSEALARLAHTGAGFSWLDAILLAGLLAGAIVGGLKARRGFAWNAETAASCLIGGALMGFASSLIPGGNDNLILAGLPMLRPHAWLAIASMALAIWIGLIVKQRARNVAAGLPDKELR